MDIEEREYKQRTIQQNKALHKYFELVAQALNDCGKDMRRTLPPSIDIPWEMITVKEYLWKPIQELQLRKKSTTELTTKELDRVLDTMTRWLGQKHGVVVDFPSIESLLMNERLKEND